MAKQRSTAPLSADALSVFCYQLSLMMHAGIGSEEGVEVLAEDAADPGSKALLTALHADLLDGAPLSQALSASGAFPGYMVRMVEIGQAAGRLDQVLSAWPPTTAGSRRQRRPSAGPSSTPPLWQCWWRRCSWCS